MLGGVELAQEGHETTVEVVDEIRESQGLEMHIQVVMKAGIEVEDEGAWLKEQAIIKEAKVPMSHKNVAPIKSRRMENHQL